MSANTSPYISIIIPTRNRPDVLAKALDGVAIQSFADYEVIVIDDGSPTKITERYPAIFARLGSRFKLLELGGNGTPGRGPSITRNHGIQCAQGEIIAFCDDDDFWTSDKHLAMMATTYQKNVDIDMYIANQRAILGEQIIKKSWLPGLDALESYKPDGFIVSVSDLCRSKDFAQLNILSMRRKIAIECGGFWTRMSYEEDRDFFWRAVDRCRQVFYNPIIIGQHNVPDPDKTNNVSSSHFATDRLLISACLSQHIAATVSKKEIIKLAGEYEGDILRKLAIALSKSGNDTVAFNIAKRALAARFSWKWCGYIIKLMLQRYLNRFYKTVLEK